MSSRFIVKIHVISTDFHEGFRYNGSRLQNKGYEYTGFEL